MHQDKTTIKVQTANLPGKECLSWNDEPSKDQTSESLTTPTTNEVTDTQNKNSSPETALSKYCRPTCLPYNPDLKYTLNKVRTVDNKSLTDVQLTSPNQIPDYIFQTLIIGDYRAREFKFKPVTSDKDKIKDDYEYDESEGNDLAINPMDAFLGIFHCSDEFVRRYLSIKLSVCQLSVPFLLPDPLAPSGNITILLSALKGITKTWKGACNNNESVKQVFATEYPFPVVSFIRIGKSAMSKSSLMNKIMSDASGGHNFFFCKSMEGGNVERKVVDGLVELTWYLPGGSKKQAFLNEICFANLRGDARYFKKQLDLLLDISSVVCLLLPLEYADTTMTDILDEATKSKAKVILIFKERSTSKYFNDLKSKHREKLSLITKAKQANKYDFLQKVRECIQENIHTVKAEPLVKLTSCVNKYGIHLDDGDQSYLRLGESVDTWLKLGIEQAKNLLKLQMHVPVLADLEREKYCPKRLGNKNDSGRIKRDTDEIYKDIEAEMTDQKESLAQLDERILHFLNRLPSMDEICRNRVLYNIKHQLDKMSLQDMAKLHQEYRVASFNFRRKKMETRQKSDTQSSEEERLKQLEESIAKCSFGLEHIIRELAQLYQLADGKNEYASAAAEILLSGHPLELLDGDSSYIPLEWFDAVYAKLEQKTNNAKIFVISVIGVQSSGKSTMLNTMFGVEFSVSAGRCTRGAFASLIPVSDSLKTASNFDYVLIIDTEGLKGSGDPQLREHDNQLATFAIGVADVTIVNIFGENHNEMKEFLEITVHAFLKMKLVEEKKACKIVHQNVAATDAPEKLIIARFKLKQDLDKMAKVAATEENCEDKFKKFNDIISFNENDDVFYIPNLSQGSPPMAPVNPEYGRAVQEIKENIITLMCLEDRFQLSVSQFRKRVTNLWEAMLKENFIFSFRNTIEVRAYTSLDRKYFEELVNLMVIGMSELVTKRRVALNKCTTQDERKEEWEATKRQIREEAEVIREKMAIKMEVFFETNEDKATLEQWKENVRIKIIQTKENQVMEATKKLKAAYQYLENRHEADKKKQTYETELLQTAKEFICSAHSTDDVKKSKVAFEQEWQQWIVKVPQCQEIRMNVNTEMVDVLSDTNPVLNTVIRDKLKQESYSISNFKEIIPIIDIDQLTITSSGNTLFNFIARQQQRQQQILFAAEAISDRAVAEALDVAKMMSKSGVRCSLNDFTQIYHKVITTIDNETEKSDFKFRKCLKCDILLYTFAHAFEIFEEMEERYFQVQDIRRDLEENLRPSLEEYFVNICSEMMGKEVAAATSIANKLQKPIESELNRTMGAVVAKEIKNNRSDFQSKGQFHASVLIQLGEEGKFESYIPYLKNPVKFLKAKLTESIENYCLEDSHASVTLLLENEAKQIKNKLFAAISTASGAQTRTGSGKLICWIEKFVDGYPTLDITKEKFPVAAISDDLFKIDVFEAKIRENVTQFLDSLIKRGVDPATIRKWNPAPHYLLESMFGCLLCCPLCKALCDQTVKNHLGNHFTRNHCPQGATGCKNEHTKILVSTICTRDVANDNMSFKNACTSKEWHHYNDYQSVNDYYKSWSIPPDPSFETSTYWQWFMATYSKELAEHYKAEEPDIPVAWKKRTFSE
ncbi:interferon-induced very large GTPase 1-like, partial [Paramuricea clavata]